MRATPPYPSVPDDNADRIMARSGTLMGMSDRYGVWRFGFSKGSDSAKAHGVSTPHFLWVIATRKTGKVWLEQYGNYTELDPMFQKVMDWEPK